MMYNSINSFLTKSQASSIIDYCKNELVLKEAKVSGGIIVSLRKSKVAFTKLKDFDFLITGLINEINKHYNVDGYQLDTDFTFQFTEYNVGEYYKWHTDSGDMPNTKRYISVVILLNDEYDGGELVFKINNTDIVMNNSIGNLFLFDSNILHKVNPVELGVRYSLVTWIGLIESPYYQKKLI